MRFLREKDLTHIIYVYIYIYTIICESSALCFSLFAQEAKHFWNQRMSNLCSNVFLMKFIAAENHEFGVF